MKEVQILIKNTKDYVQTLKFNFEKLGIIYTSGDWI